MAANFKRSSERSFTITITFTEEDGFSKSEITKLILEHFHQRLGESIQRTQTEYTLYLQKSVSLLLNEKPLSSLRAAFLINKTGHNLP